MTGLNDWVRVCTLVNAKDADSIYLDPYLDNVSARVGYSLGALVEHRISGVIAEGRSWILIYFLFPSCHRPIVLTGLCREVPRVGGRGIQVKLLYFFVLSSTSTETIHVYTKRMCELEGDPESTGMEIDGFHTFASYSTKNRNS